jgi:hypothetical protein
MLTVPKPCFNEELLMSGWSNGCELALCIFNHISAAVCDQAD